MAPDVLLGRMDRHIIRASARFLALAACVVAAGSSAAAAANPDIAFDDAGRLSRPADYREWIYLSSGFDMSYTARAGGGHSMFDNVFVNRSAYDAFRRSGHWPDGTILVLEVRGAESKGSINKAGHFQSREVMGLEAHVRDARIPGGWGFYAFEDKAVATRLPRTEDCYACHEKHGAVDTTFVQFYPTLDR
jgi:hypothetical protein